MKGKKDPKKSKQGRPLKELLPAGFTKAAREAQAITISDTTPSIPSFDITPPTICPNWPGDESALSHDFNLNSTSLFEDDWEYSFPPSFYSFCANGRISWRQLDDLASTNDSVRSTGRRVSAKKTIVHQPTSRDHTKNLIEEAEDAGGWAVVSYIEREETQEELELRRQRELEKFMASKKKGKPEEVHLGKVKEVKLSNVELGTNLPLCCRWISSQLQILKDKAWSFGGESIWSRIFPQRDGIPIYNPCGRYWVKLWLLGSYKLVEIDCKIPTLEGNILLPKSSSFRDLWPLLLSKAYFKLYSYRWRNIAKFVQNPNQELDGSFVYSLTGLMPQHSAIEHMGINEWESLRGLLTDEQWEMNLNFIAVFCEIDTNHSIPSNSYIDEEEEKIPKEQDKTFHEAEEGFKSKGHSARENTEVPGQSRKVHFAPRPKPVGIVQGFGYLLTDLFANPEDFDMRKVQQKEKQRQEDEIKNLLLKAKASSPARKLKRHQSPARARELHKKRERRGKEKEERRQKRLESRNYPVYKLIRIKSGISGVPQITVEAPFNHSELDEARLRLLNREYFMNKELEELERLMDEEDIELFDPKDSNEIDVYKVIREDRLEGLVQPKQRCQAGVWFAAEDFPAALPKCMIFHEITHFPNKLSLDDIWKDRSQPYQHNSNFDVWLIDPQSTDLVSLVVAFSPLLPEGSLFPPDSVYFQLQKYDFEKESVIDWAQEFRLTTTSIISNSYSFAGECLVLRPLVSNCPCGYMAWVSSTSPITTMSRLQYLVEKTGWAQNRLVFDYPFLPRGLLFLLLKIEVSSEEAQGNMVKISASDPNLLQYCKLILIDRDTSINELNYSFLEISTLETQRIVFVPNQRGYRLLLVAMTPGNLQEGTVTVDILSKNGDSLRAVAGEMMDPMEFSDRYVPNKYGIIFKEQIFVPEEVHFSLHMRMRKGGLPVVGGKGKEISPEEPLQTSHLILLEIYDGEELIAATKGYNQAIIPHLNLKTASKELLMICKYDIDEWPECKAASPELHDVNWVLRVVSSDTIALVKDTRKEDKEEAIRKSWETSQAGRAEQAKQSRQRFLALAKSQRGEDLNDHEKEIMKETWQERRKAKKEIEAAGKGKVKGKEDKKQKEAEKPIVVEIEIANPEDHVMIPIKRFLSHIQAERFIRIGGDDRILFTTQLIEQTKQRIKGDMQVYNEAYLQKKAARVQEKAKLDSLKESFKELMSSKKEAAEQKLVVYKEARTVYQAKIDVKKENALKLQNALAANDANLIDAAVNDCNISGSEGNLLAQAIKTLKKIRIQKCSESLKKAFAENKLVDITSALVAIKNYDIAHELDFKMVSKAQILMTRAENLQKVLVEPEVFGIEGILKLLQEAQGNPSLDATALQVTQALPSLKVRCLEARLRNAVGERDVNAIQLVLRDAEGFSLDSMLIESAQEIIG